MKQLRHYTMVIVLLFSSSVFSQVCPGPITLTSQTEVDNFNCTEVTGDLKISYPISNITNLNGLSGLTSVGGNLNISENHVLQNLNGLSDLAFVGGTFTLASNRALENLDGLTGLTSVGGSLVLYRNDGLLNVDGLSGLNSIGANFTLYYNEKLANLDGLSGLTSVGANFSLYYNEKLANLDGLSGLKSIKGGLDITENQVLLNLDGLLNLTSVGGSLSLSQNINLLNMDGLSGLTSVGGGITISDNSKLTNINSLSGLSSIVNDLLIVSNKALLNLDGLSRVDTFGGRLLLIVSNSSLDEFCGLYHLLDQNASKITLLSIDGNADDPSVAEILSDGPCEQGGFQGVVWYDENQNGQQDEGESGLWGATVRLTDADGNLVSKAATLPSGFYYLKRVPTGEFSVQVDESTLTLSDPVLTTSDNPIVVERDDIDEMQRFDFGFYGSKTTLTEEFPEPDPNLTDNALVLVSGSPTNKVGKETCDWANAVDGDVEGWDGTTVARNQNNPSDPAWAIFQFNSGEMFKFNIIAFQTDNGTDDDGAKYNIQTQQFEFLVSTDGIDSDDFTSLGIYDRRYDGQDMEYIKLGRMVQARYIKIRLLSPQMPGGWRQIVEFQPTTFAKNGAIPASSSEHLVVVPEELSLKAFPNPFNPATTISYTVVQGGPIRLVVYDLTGREVARLVDGFQAVGEYQVNWNASDMPSGIYFVRMTQAGDQRVERISLVK